MNESLEPLPHTNQSAEKEPFLSYEAFASRDQYGHPHYNNFIVPFLDHDGPAVRMYRSFPHIQRLISEQPEIFDSLCKKLKPFVPANYAQIGEYYGQDLYDVYKILRGYGMSDENLFI